MQKAKEEKIRETLKKVYDSFDEVSDFIFTTFDFDPDFFEEQIVTFLMGIDRKISTIGELNATNEWIRKNNICVYYDKDALKSASSCVTMPAYSQYVKKGVFHPKVIVIYGTLKNGEKAAYLIVSSCNLTVSGFGRNMEAFSCIRVENTQVAQSLLLFIEKLRGEHKDRHKDVIGFLNSDSFDENDEIEFFWNYENDGMTLLEKISELPEGDLRIISPYFDECGPSGLLQEIKGKKDVNIYPALDGEKYNIHITEYERLKGIGVKFSCICPKDKAQRFVHAKMIQKGDRFIVGSYNFTTAALKGINAEAALIIKQSDELIFDEQVIEESRFIPDTEKIGNGDSVKRPEKSVFFTFIVDWGRNLLTIQTNQTLKEPNVAYNVKLDGVDHEGWTVNEDIEEEIDDATKKALLRHKQFSVFLNGRFCSKGIVVELNWEGYRPELVCNSLSETISEWYDNDDSKKHKERKYELRYFSDSEEENDLERVESGVTNNSQDLFDNYFLVAYSLERLCREIDQSDKKKPEGLYGILVSKPGSMSRILDFVELDEKNKGRDEVYYWLVVKYLRKAFDRLPEKCDQKEFEANYKQQMQAFEIRLKSVEKKISGRIKARPQYIEWIEKEFFKCEDNDV